MSYRLAFRISLRAVLRRSLLGWLALALAAYLAMGAFLVPQWMKPRVEQWFTSVHEGPVSIGQLRFNPLNWRFQIEDIRGQSLDAAQPIRWQMDHIGWSVAPWRKWRISLQQPELEWTGIRVSSGQARIPEVVPGTPGAWLAAQLDRAGPWLLEHVDQLQWSQGQLRFVTDTQDAEVAVAPAVDYQLLRGRISALAGSRLRTSLEVSGATFGSATVEAEWIVANSRIQGEIQLQDWTAASHPSATVVRFAASTPVNAARQLQAEFSAGWGADGIRAEIGPGRLGLAAGDACLNAWLCLPHAEFESGFEGRWEWSGVEPRLLLAGGRVEGFAESWSPGWAAAVPVRQWQQMEWRVDYDQAGAQRFEVRLQGVEDVSTRISGLAAAGGSGHMRFEFRNLPGSWLWDESVLPASSPENSAVQADARVRWDSNRWWLEGDWSLKTQNEEIAGLAQAQGNQPGSGRYDWQLVLQQPGGALASRFLAAAYGVDWQGGVLSIQLGSMATAAEPGSESPRSATQSAIQAPTQPDLVVTWHEVEPQAKASLASRTHSGFEPPLGSSLEPQPELTGASGSAGSEAQMLAALLLDVDNQLQLHQVSKAGGWRAPTEALARLSGDLHTQLDEMLSAPEVTAAHLVGTEPEELLQINFLAGEATVLPAGRAALRALGSLLRMRPRLAVEITPVLDPLVDRTELQVKQLRTHVGLATASELSFQAGDLPPDFSDRKVHSVLDEFARRRLSPEVQAAFAEHFGTADADSGVLPDGDPEIYYQALFELLVEHAEVPETALTSLARYRRQAVTEQLAAQQVDERQMLSAPDLLRVNARSQGVIMPLRLLPAAAPETLLPDLLNKEAPAEDSAQASDRPQ